MFKEVLFDSLRSDLEREIAESPKTPQVCPTRANQYLAMSGLQKGIRRGDLDVALRCAARLLTDNPTAFWRRIAIISIEDIGVADTELVGRVVAVLGNKKWRGSQGGEWSVAAHLVARLCGSIKDRSADDLIDVIQYLPDLDNLRGELPEQSLSALLAVTGDTKRRTDVRGLAAWFSVGSDRIKGQGLAEVPGDPTAYFDSLIEAGIAESIVEIGRAGLSKTGVILPVFFPLLWQASQRAARDTEADEFPEVRQIGDLPSYVFDIFTRDGLAAYKRYLHHSEAMRTFLGRHAPDGRNWHRIVGRLVFRIESGLLDRRLSWHLGKELRAKADVLGRGIPSDAVPEGFEILHREIGLLNEARAEAASKGF